ncbi:Sua5/YciO/YrdC/YwlC family protein [bacterium]|nr:Sua5/YciO/YrdC/YwlC family protein [bacterium]
MAEIYRLTSKIPTELLRKISETLSNGGVIIVSTDTVYGLFAEAFNSTAFERIEKIKDCRNLPYVVMFESIQHLKQYFSLLNPFQRRFIEALASIPATFILDPIENIPADFRYEKFGIGVRIAQNDHIIDISKQSVLPLWATSANRSGGATPVEFTEINSDLINEADIVLDTGRTSFAKASTVIDIRKFPFKILRQGALMEDIEGVIKHSTEPLEVLIVCTGNICRSPLAEALLKKEFGDPMQSGVRISSAGTHASPGFPATDLMLNIAREWGIDYSDHEARIFDKALVYKSDVILVNEDAHADWIIQKYPDIADRIKYLGEPLGLEDIPDPYGSDRDVYIKSANIIKSAVDEWNVRLKQLVRDIGWKPTSDET